MSDVPLIIAVGSKDLLTSLTTQLNNIYRSIRGDDNFMRFEFETYIVRHMICIRGTTNLADLGTKSNSPLTQTIQLQLYSGKIPMYFTQNGVRRLS